MPLPRLSHDLNHFFDLTVVDSEGRCKPDDVVVSRLRYHSILKQAQRKVPNVELLVNEFDSYEETATAYLLHTRAREDALEGLEDLLPLFE